MATGGNKDAVSCGYHSFSGQQSKTRRIGANLFKTLRKFDFLGVDVVYSEVFSEKGEGMAIMNRLNKAAGYRVLEAE